MNITDVDINKLNMPEDFRSAMATALLELQDRFDENDWNGILTKQQIEGLYSYEFTRFEEQDKQSYEGEVDFENKTLRIPNGPIDIQTLKHELVHVLKGQKEKAKIKSQGVKQIYPDGSAKGKALEEYLTEYISGGTGEGVYRDGTVIAQLMHKILGQDVIKASLSNDRTQLEDVFYYRTGGDETFQDFEPSVDLLKTSNDQSNEVAMLRPVIEMIQLYDIERREILAGEVVTRQDVAIMLERDLQIKDMLKNVPYKELGEMAIEIFDKLSQDLYTNPEIIDDMDVLASEMLEKHTRTMLDRDLSQIDASYIESAMNGGEPLYQRYLSQIDEMIEDGEFSKDENGLKLYLQIMSNVNHDIGEEVIKHSRIIEGRIGGEDINPWMIDTEELYDRPELKELHKKFSVYIFGQENSDFEAFLKNMITLPQTEGGKKVFADKLKGFIEQSKQQQEQQMTPTQIYDTFGLKDVKQTDVENVFEQVKQEQQKGENQITQEEGRG